MAFLSPKEIAQLAVETGEKKAKMGAGSTLILGFLAGVFIAFQNFIPVLLGNIVGGAVFVGLLYCIVYLRNTKPETSVATSQVIQTQL